MPDDDLADDALADDDPAGDDPAGDAGPADARRTLTALRDELLGRAAALRSGADVPSGGISFGKRVGEGTNIAIERFADVAIHEQVMHQLAGVEAALQRLDDGVYGSCTVCGRAIHPERLEAVPWAATCVACA